MYEELSDYHEPQEVPGLSTLTSRIRRFHDCLDEAMERHRGEEDDKLFAVAVLQDLADGCRQMGLEQDFCVRLAGFQSIFLRDEELIKTRDGGTGSSSPKYAGSDRVLNLSVVEAA